MKSLSNRDCDTFKRKKLFLDFKRIRYENLNTLLTQLKLDKIMFTLQTFNKTLTSIMYWFVPLK